MLSSRNAWTIFLLADPKSTSITNTKLFAHKEANMLKLIHLVSHLAHYMHTVVAAGVTIGITVEFIEKVHEWLHLLGELR
jgi:hypothetical protein